MSPTVLRYKNYRFYFLSNEQQRIHVHIDCQEGEAKFWIEPIVSLATCRGLNSRKLNELEKLVKRHKHEIIEKWKKHFGRQH